MRRSCGSAKSLTPKANVTPIVVSNRVGHEVGKSCELTFYGTSFIADESGQIVAQLGREEEGVLTHTFDLTAISQLRAEWGIFRDRRADLYKVLTTLDGNVKSS
jgi:N-carbamoylputrescine amidase